MIERRAQSEVVGMVLLVAIVVIAVSTVGTILFLGFDAPETPAAEATATVTEEGVTLTHAGGEPVAYADLVVVIEAESSRHAGAFESEYADGSSTKWYTPGTNWERSFDSLGMNVEPGEHVRVRLLHEPSGEALFRGTLRVETVA